MSDIYNIDIDKVQIDTLIQGNNIQGSGNVVGNRTYNVGSNVSSENHYHYLDQNVIFDLLRALYEVRSAAQFIPYEYQGSANEHIDEIEKELNEKSPRFGKIRAAFDALRRLCTNSGFLDAVKVFGDLLIQAVK